MMLWHAAAAALIAAAAGASAGWQARGWKADADELQRVQAEQRDTLRRQEAGFGAAGRLEQQRERTRTEIVTVTREVPYVVARSVYRAECWDADGLRLITQAIGATADTAQPDGPMPAASAAR